MEGFKKAERKNIKIKLAISGPSGSGKTFSALALATGLSDGGKIALIDTEQTRASMYSDDFNFETVGLSKPFSPENYQNFIDLAVNKGFNVCIIDSMSHEWDYILEEKEKKDKTSKSGNSFTNWREFKSRHNRFLQHLLQSDIHVIATYRSKTQYVLQENERGRLVPRKLGMGIQGQDNDEYEFTIHFEMTKEGHLAEVSKDNTKLFDGKTFQITELDGKKILDWLKGGKLVKKEDNKEQLISKIVQQMQKQTSTMETKKEKENFWLATLDIYPNELKMKTESELKVILENL